MKILFDENISWRIVKKTEPFFTEVVHVSELQIIQPATDISIWNYAKKNDFTIITKDDDFEKLVLLKKAPPKVVHLKTFNLNTNNLAELIAMNSNKIKDFINSTEEIFEIYSK